MQTSAIVSLATGVPEGRYAQADIADYFIALQKQETRRARAIRTIFDRAGVRFRHMTVDEHFHAQERSTQERNDVYMAQAVPLGEKTIRCALDKAGLRPDAIDDFIVVSCTGFNIPGLDLHLAARLGMRHDLQRSCILGMGCYGAFPGLLRARHSAAFGRRALVLTLELCSLHLQMDDSAENVVSSALFADGAAAAVVAPSADAPRRTPHLIHSETYSDYTTLDHMSFTITDQGFRMYLSSYVPELLAANIDSFVGKMLAKKGLNCRDVRFWGIHPGSSKIVDYVQARLGLTDGQVEQSHAVLQDYGNMSSATILFVLDRIQRCEHPQPGDYGVLLAFGPGLTMEGLLVQW